MSENLLERLQAGSPPWEPRLRVGGSERLSVIPHVRGRRASRRDAGCVGSAHDNRILVTGPQGPDGKLWKQRKGRGLEFGDPRRCQSRGEAEGHPVPGPVCSPQTAVKGVTGDAPTPTAPATKGPVRAGCTRGQGHGHTAQRGCPRPQRKGSDGLTPRCENPGQWPSYTRRCLPVPMSPGATRCLSRSTVVAAQPGKKGGPMPGPDAVGRRHVLDGEMAVHD